MKNNAKIMVDCFEKKVPAAMEAIYEINHNYGIDISESINNLKDHLRVCITQHKKIDFKDETTLDMIMEVVNSYGNYYGFLGLLDQIKQQFPTDSLTFLSEDPEKETKFKDFRDSLDLIFNKPRESSIDELNNALKSICDFVIRSESVYKTLKDENIN